MNPKIFFFGIQRFFSVMIALDFPMIVAHIYNLGLWGAFPTLLGQREPDLCLSRDPRLYPTSDSELRPGMVSRLGTMSGKGRLSVTLFHTTPARAWLC